MQNKIGKISGIIILATNHDDQHLICQHSSPRAIFPIPIPNLREFQIVPSAMFLVISRQMKNALPAIQK